MLVLHGSADAIVMLQLRLCAVFLRVAGVPLQGFLLLDVLQPDARRTSDTASAAGPFDSAQAAKAEVWGFMARLVSCVVESAAFVCRSTNCF
jgi:hypothetical protein